MAQIAMLLPSTAQLAFLDLHASLTAPGSASNIQHMHSVPKHLTPPTHTLSTQRLRLDPLTCFCV